MLLALIQCLVCTYKGRKRQYSTEGESGQLRRGDTIAGLVQWVKNKIRGLVNKIQKNKTPHTPATPSERMAKEISMTPIHKKCDFSHVYDLEKFFKSCDTVIPSPEFLHFH